MFIYLADWGLTVGALLVLGACGFGPALALRYSVRFPILAAPLIGMLTAPLVTLLFYFTLGQGLAVSSGASVVVLLLVSAAMTWSNRAAISPIDVAITAACLMLGAGAFVWLSEAASIVKGMPSILYLDGTDHLGYANVADWMVNHVAGDAPKADPLAPYESLPNILLPFDTRTGAFAFLAIVSVFTGLSPTFAYDGACAILLVAGIAGVAGAYVRSYSALGFLAIGLAISQWLELTHSGFLGKSLAYPSILFLIGVLARANFPMRTPQMLVLALVSVGSGLMLSGLVTAMLLFAFVGSSIALRFFFERKIDGPRFEALLLLSLVAVVADGFIVAWRGGLPLVGVGPSIKNVLRSLDLYGLFTDINIFLGYGLLIVATAAGAILVKTAISNRDFAAASLIGGSVFLPELLFLLGRGNIMLQFGGFLYPAALCGAASLLPLPSLAIPRQRLLAEIAIVAVAATRLPHGFAAIDRYTSPPTLAGAFTREEFRGLANAIGNKSVLIDLSEPPSHAVNILLVELGRGSPALQWTPATWHSLFSGWRPEWSTPLPHVAADLRLVAAESRDGRRPILTTTHYSLLVNSP